jgi:hypothetical protein
MTCPFSRRLTAASTGEDIAAELHAETCARCRAELDAMIELVDLARRLPAPSALSPERRAAIRAGALATAELAPRAPVRATPRLRRVAIAAGVLAAAAAIAVATWDARDALKPAVAVRVAAEVPPPPVAPKAPPPAAPMPAPDPQIADVAPAAAAPHQIAAAPRVAPDPRSPALPPEGTSTIDAHTAAPVQLVAGDTTVRVASSTVEVTSRRGVVTMVRVLAGAAQIEQTGHVQILAAGEIWVRPDEPPRQTAEASFEAFERGWAALRLGHYADAIAAFDQADDPGVVEDAAYWAAIACARAGHRTEAARRLRGFLARFPTAARVEAARGALAQLAP